MKKDIYFDDTTKCLTSRGLIPIKDLDPKKNAIVVFNSSKNAIEYTKNYIVTVQPQDSYTHIYGGTYVLRSTCPRLTENRNTISLYALEKKDTDVRVDTNNENLGASIKWSHYIWLKLFCLCYGDINLGSSVSKGYIRVPLAGAEYMKKTFMSNIMNLYPDLGIEETDSEYIIRTNKLCSTVEETILEMIHPYAIECCYNVLMVGKDLGIILPRKLKNKRLSNNLYSFFHKSRDIIEILQVYASFCGISAKTGSYGGNYFIEFDFQTDLSKNLDGISYFVNKLPGLTNFYAIALDTTEDKYPVLMTEDRYNTGVFYADNVKNVFDTTVKQNSV